ncbi:hypothetical protein PIB30_052703 [Stylosanthes scabra]|uniref:Uncharacterized protein n=1 Tax=Stylosanthes scabra TaxID=79078 RepID=A0ABU6XIG4_9FABA|nr:hypothetical protein [Stylosanthes scabra]
MVLACYECASIEHGQQLFRQGWIDAEDGGAVAGHGQRMSPWRLQWFRVKVAVCVEDDDEVGGTVMTNSKGGRRTNDGGVFGCFGSGGERSFRVDEDHGGKDGNSAMKSNSDGHDSGAIRRRRTLGGRRWRAGSFRTAQLREGAADPDPEFSLSLSLSVAGDEGGGGGRSGVGGDDRSGFHRDERRQRWAA